MGQSTRDLVIYHKGTDQWHRYPWARVHELARAIAARILDRADGACPTVGLVGEPSLEFVATLPAVWIAGGSFTVAPGPVRGADPARWAATTLERFQTAGVTTVYSHGSTLELMRAITPGLPVEDLAQVATDAEVHAGRQAAPVRRSDAAILQSTAGSTGVPQTVSIPARAVLANVGGLSERFGIGSADTGCSWLPLYHDMGLIFLLTCMLHGSELWLAPTSAFSAAPMRWLDWLTESQATLTAAPNFAYNLVGRFARRIGEVDLGWLRMALNGGEPVDCDGFARFSDEMARFGFDPGAATPAYGLAEATCAVTAPPLGMGLRHDVTVPPPGDGPSAVKHALLGTPIAGMELRVCPTKALAHLGREIGEVEIRGTSMMSGYLGSAPVCTDEWFPTGDLGYLTADGLVVCGRRKEVIHLAGRNLFPTEIERVAATVAGIRVGGVVATDVALGGRNGLAIVAEYRGEGHHQAKRQVLECVAAECGVVASKVELVDPGALPRTTSGKLRRTAVRDQLGTGAWAGSVREETRT
ncbi:MAG TPA: long-chain-fatty acid--ACP ligase MbtM [Mycobacterium sp.]|nr:long-chain-fatty acid--ACP ligase MbtM [Mycobacterium sp.]